MKRILLILVILWAGPVLAVDSITDTAKQEATRYIIKEFIKSQLEKTVLIASYSINSDSPGTVSQMPSILIKRTDGTGFEVQRLGSANQKLAGEYSWKWNKTSITETITNYGLYDSENRLSSKTVLELPIQKPFVLRYGAEIMTAGFDASETYLLPRLGLDYYYTDDFISADISRERLSEINSTGLTVANHNCLQALRLTEGFYLNDMGSKSVFIGAEYHNIFLSLSHCIRYENNPFTRDTVTVGYILRF